MLAATWLLAALSAAATNHARTALAQARFSLLEPGQTPDPWSIQDLRGRPATSFQLVRDGDDVVVESRADDAVAALVLDLHVEPTAPFILSWRWKTDRLLKTSDITTRRGDDFVARVYVLFDYELRRLPWLARTRLRLARLIYGASVPTAALCYVWDRDAPVGTIVPNAYTDRVRMVVVESGAARLGRWVAETRDAHADFRRAFGEQPPAIIGIAIATDTDDTGESARARFGDLLLADRMPALQ